MLLLRRQAEALAAGTLFFRRRRYVSTERQERVLRGEGAYIKRLLDEAERRVMALRR